MEEEHVLTSNNAKKNSGKKRAYSDLKSETDSFAQNGSNSFLSKVLLKSELPEDKLSPIECRALRLSPAEVKTFLNERQLSTKEVDFFPYNFFIIFSCNEIGCWSSWFREL